jgi:hypothetical protein
MFTPCSVRDLKRAICAVVSTTGAGTSCLRTGSENDPEPDHRSAKCVISRENSAAREPKNGASSASLPALPWLTPPKRPPRE